MRNLIQQLQHIYNNLKDSNEIDIIERYGRNAKYYTVLITTLFVSSVFILLIVQMWPDIQQIISPSNKSRSYHLQISVEYFVDQEKYFYCLLVHVNAAVCIGLFAAAAIATMLIAYFQYMCAMFTIASYRIENTMKLLMFQDIIPENRNLIHKSIKNAVDIHRKAIEFSIHLTSKCEMSFLFLIIFGVMTISMNIFRFFQIASSTRNFVELSISFIIGSICLLYMFIANFVGQIVTDHYNYIYAAAYKIQWYIAPLDIQKLILILIQRGNKNFGLTFGKLFVASVQCFSTLANACLSYFTVMYSVQ
ncbi:uncharacterized protein [Anoplolepis gracilipes]